MVNGCQIARDLRQQYAPNTEPLRPAQCVPLQPLREEDVRRIVREEIERANKGQST
jgi:hypothetical protein